MFPVQVIRLLQPLSLHSVIATFVAAFLGGATPGEAAALSNIAAGAVCEEPGIIPITMAMLERAIQQVEELYDPST